MLTFEEVEKASRQIRGVAHRTPVATSRLLDDGCSARLFLKCENLQRGGAFKFRGAYNAVSRLTEAERRRGVVTFSSGNHAQAVALVGRLLNIPVTIVMPQSAPAMKLAATRGYGADVRTYDPATESREDIARELAESRGSTLIPPFDHPHVIAGQGTAAAELFEDAGPLDVLLVPCGGGGLLSGSALAARRLSPRCKVVGVEPEAGNDAVLSFRSRVLHSVHNPRTIADGARTSSLGEWTFPLVLANVDDLITVSDDDLVETMQFVWTRMKLVVEPTGVLGLAAAFTGKLDIRGRKVGVILSGGNVDIASAAGWFTAMRDIRSAEKGRVD